MSNYYDSFRAEAKKRLDAECKEKLDRYGEVMKRPVHDTLLTFCEQNGEFAQAVAQGGSFKDCMAAVSKCVKGNALSDMEAYGAAVRFYFPGAGIDVKMTINLCASVEVKSEAKKPDLPPAGRKPESEGIVIDLSDFF